MAARKLDDISANVASNSPLPLRVQKLIIGANNRSTTDRGVFGQRERCSEWVRRLGPQPSEGGRDGVIVAVGVEQFSRNVDIDPCCSQLRVRLAQSLVPVRICDVGLLLTLVNEASSGGWNRGGQINQMSNRSPSRDQRTRGPAQRMSYDHDNVVAPIKGSTNHVGVRVKRRRRPVIARQIRRDHVMARLL
jgi:hypothetical protein